MVNAKHTANDMSKDLPEWHLGYTTTDREVRVCVDILSESNSHIFLMLSIISSSHLPQVIKSCLQVIVDSTVHPTGRFSLSRCLSCCDWLADCSRRCLDKLG
jgi:hypothetical protein